MTDPERTGYPQDFPWDGAFTVSDVQRRSWWPYRPVEGVVDSLWLLGREAAVDASFGRLITGWGATVDWFAAGTSLHRAGDEPASWATGHASLAGERLGHLQMEDGALFGRGMEWWRLTASAEGLHVLLQGPLQHPGRGWWLAASPDAGAGQRFIKATTGLLWWLSRDYRPYAGPTHEIVDDSVKEALLGLLPQVGFVSVVPLNGHPVHGVVLLGSPEEISRAAASVGHVAASEGAEVEALWARGGWLVTG